MDYPTSTQKAKYTFTAEELADIRTSVNVQRVEKVMAERAAAACQASTAPGPLPDALNADEELSMIKYYESKIQDFSRALHLPPKVQGTALMYLKRFYLKTSILEVDPKNIMLTCLYLAGKVEDYYRSADELAKVGRTDADIILRREIPVLEALGFCLIVHTPPRAIEGFFADIAQLQGSDTPLGATLKAHDGQALAAAKSAAIGAANLIMLSDAPLIFSPSQCALAAVRSGFNQHKMELGTYLEHAAAKARTHMDVGEAVAQETVAELKAKLDMIDKHGMEGYKRAKALKADLSVIKQLEARRSAFAKASSTKSKSAKASKSGKSSENASSGKSKKRNPAKLTPTSDPKRMALSPRNNLPT